MSKKTIKIICLIIASVFIIGSIALPIISAFSSSGDTYAQDISSQAKGSFLDSLFKLCKEYGSIIFFIIIFSLFSFLKSKSNFKKIDEPIKTFRNDYKKNGGYYEK